MICLKLVSCLDLKTNVFVHQYVPLAQYKGLWQKYLQKFLKNYQILVINNLDKYGEGGGDLHAGVYGLKKNAIKIVQA